MWFRQVHHRSGECHELLRGQVHVDVLGAMRVGSTDTMRRDTLSRIASIAKPITATAAMFRVEGCKLGLDEPVDRWLSEPEI
jgi:CubicO group peptidase (beta-lactamase class C family)